MDSFLEDNNLLTTNQYGFRNKSSTSYALFDLIEEITNAIDKRKYSVGLFIDLTKAFDTINHTILINKLEQYGVRGVALQWLISYLSNRMQCVRMGNCQSKCLNMICGLPQGSVLSPKLFSIYINDICKTSQLLRFILFADDTNIFASGANLQQLLQTVTLEFSKVNQWLKQNKLALNLNKSKFIIFSNCNPNSQARIQLEGIDIERVHEIKFLGVIIDEKITWKHVKYISTKISRSISVIAKVKYMLNSASLHILYCSMILPYLNYCTFVWGNTYNSTLKPLLTLQKRAIRLIHKVHFLEHTNLLFFKSKIIKFYDIVEFQTAQFVYKACNKKLPYHLQNKFKNYTGCYKLRNELNFKIPLFRTRKKSFSITITGVRLWNSLKMDLKQSQNIDHFKNRYKKMLFEKYNDQEPTSH